VLKLRRSRRSSLIRVCDLGEHALRARMEFRIGALKTQITGAVT